MFILELDVNKSYHTGTRQFQKLCVDRYEQYETSPHLIGILPRKQMIRIRKIINKKKPSIQCLFVFVRPDNQS